MTKTLTALFLSITFFFGLTTAASAAYQPEAHGPVTPTRWSAVECEFEDSLNCYWDAGDSGLGNGGHSFYSIKAGNLMCTIYWNNRYARKHNTCDPID